MWWGGTADGARESQFLPAIGGGQHNDRAAMQGPLALCCPTPRGEAGERGRRGSVTGRPLRNAINSCIRNV